MYGDREGVKPVSNYEHVREVEHFGDVTKFHPFNQCREHALVDWLQPIDQDGKDIVSVNCGHNAFVEIKAVPQFVPSIAVVRKRCLRPAALG